MRPEGEAVARCSGGGKGGFSRPLGCTQANDAHPVAPPPAREEIKRRLCEISWHGDRLADACRLRQCVNHRRIVV